MQELEYVIQLFYREPAYIHALVAAILSITTSKETDSWNTLILVAMKKTDRNLEDALVSECTKLKQGERALAQLADMLDKRETRDYFLRTIAPQSREIIRSQKSQSGFGRMFGGLFSGDDDPNRRK